MINTTIGKAIWIIVAGILIVIVLTGLYAFLADAQGVMQFMKRSESY